MSSLSHKASKKCHVCKRPFGSNLESVLGTCKHRVCVDCIAGEEAARRGLFGAGAAVGPLLPCPVPACERGRFDADGLHPRRDVPRVIDLRGDVDGVISSDKGMDDVLSVGTPYAQYAQPVKRVCSSSIGVLVTPIPMKVKSKHGCIVNSNKADTTHIPNDSAAPSRKVKSEVVASKHNIHPCKAETDEDSRFSEPDVKAEADQDSRFSELNAKAETDEDSRFSEHLDFKAETDEGSRFSEMDSKAETDEGSRFSELDSKAETDEDSRFSNAPDHPNETKSDEPASIKEEPSFYELGKREAKNSRKYGDRVLLARQSKIGMMKLGGGNIASHLYPKDPEEQSARMGGRYCMAYNCQWNFGAPKYAGQPSGHVTMFPRGHEFDPETCPFSVFVMRTVGQSTLGWEYCGEYVLLDHLKGTIRAHCVSEEDKKSILNDIKRSLNRANGLWHEGIKHHRDKIMKKCERDRSPPGPTRLIRFINEEPEPEDEGHEREERLNGESREKATDAAKARALGLDDEDLSDIGFAKRLIHYDDFYGSFAIKFVRYDEEIYNFVKDGTTTKNKHNKKRAGDEPCAKASDWYNIMDQQLEGNHRKMEKQRKRKRL